MRTSRGILRVLLLFALGSALPTGLAGCEKADSGFLAVTWRFNGHAGEGGARPCAAIGADRIVIELDGPVQFYDVVACDNVDPEYPLLWLNFVADLPVKAFGRLLRSVPEGKYDVRVFFIDGEGNQTPDPPMLEERVTIEREEYSRIDLDFSVTTGAISARWRLGGLTANVTSCEAVDGSFIRLQAFHTGGGALAAEVVTECGVTAGAVLPGLDPGDYDLAGQLLDEAESPITDTVTEPEVTVTELGLTAVTLSFPWTSFTPPVTGNVGIQVTYDDEDTLCSEVTGLAQGSLETRMSLADNQGQGVTGVVAYANPDGLTDCAGLTVAQAADGTTRAACRDEALLLCGLEAGTYQLTVEALDASDLVCYGATVPVDVTPLPVEEPVAVVLASSDASACWE